MVLYLLIKVSFGGAAILLSVLLIMRTFYGCGMGSPPDVSALLHDGDPCEADRDCADISVCGDPSPSHRITMRISGKWSLHQNRH